MQLIIISPPADYPQEPRVVGRILQQSSATFHLRKPGRGKRELDAYLQGIPAGLHGRIMVHGYPELLGRFALKGVHFTEGQRTTDPQTVGRLRRERPEARISSSFHRLADIPAVGGPFDYVFLSPVFDSISKAGYRAAFDHHELQRFLAAIDQKVVALGGIDGRWIGEAAALGFAGVAVLGAVWSGNDPEKAALALAATCRKPFFDRSRQSTADCQS